MLIRAAGVLELLVIAANLPFSWILGLGRRDPQSAAIISQIHRVHHTALMALLLGVAAISLGFPGELEGASPLGRFLSGGLAVFWAARWAVQRWYYDPELRRRYRAADVVFSSIFLFLCGAYAAGAAGVLR